MANQIQGVYEKILECAQKEFLEKGFKDASLRTIATNAETSTGSIYTRFQDKEGLFRAIVNPAAEGLKNKFLEVHIHFHESEESEQMNHMDDYSLKALMGIIDYIYSQFTKFDLLVNHSYGTEFSEFIDELVEIEAEYTRKFMDVTGCTTVKDGVISKEILHIITTAYINGIFEVVRHKMSIEEAKKYISIFHRYNRKGYDIIYEEFEE